MMRWQANDYIRVPFEIACVASFPIQLIVTLSSFHRGSCNTNVGRNLPVICKNTN